MRGMRLFPKGVQDQDFRAFHFFKRFFGDKARVRYIGEVFEPETQDGEPAMHHGKGRDVNSHEIQGFFYGEEFELGNAPAELGRIETIVEPCFNFLQNMGCAE